MNKKILVYFIVLLFAVTTPATSVTAAPPTEESEFYYGVEYDWNSINPDIENFTGLDLPEIFSEFMGAASDSGFELIIGQINSGSSNIYTHYSEDISPQTIKDVNGMDVDVWSRTNDVTIRHGGLVNGIFMTEWLEQSFGSDPTGFDVDIELSLENMLNVDITYVEYFNDDSHLVGADMAFSITTSSAVGFSFDAEIQGNGDNIPVDFDLDMSYGFSITNSQTEWRLEYPSPVYTSFSSGSDGVWDCNIDDDCGTIIGDFDASIDYSFSVSGVPTEDFGFDDGEFDIEVSDMISKTDLEFDENIYDVYVEYYTGDSKVIDLGDGTSTNVVECESCPPGNPLMFLMMREVITNSGQTFAEEIADEFADNLDEDLQDLLGLDNSDEIDGCTDDEANNYDEEATSDDGSCEYSDEDNGEYPMFECTDGTMIYEWRVDNQYYDCPDRSDEHVLSVRASISMYDGISGGMTVDNANPQYNGISCDDIYFNYKTVYFINNGYDDCEDGSDEPIDYDEDGVVDNYFACEASGNYITIDKVMDGVDDCPHGSDEGKENYYYDLDLTIHNEDGTVLKHRSVQVCSDPGEDNINCNYSIYSPPDMVESLSLWEEEHEEVVCLSWELKDEFETLSTGTDCITTGLEFEYLWLYQEWYGSNYLTIEGVILGTHLDDGHSIDFALTDPNQQVIWTEQFSSIPQWFDDYINVRDYGPGDYCLTGTIYDSEGTIEDTIETCNYYEYQEYQGDDSDESDEISDRLGIELSEKLNNIIDAMADSNLQNVMTTFGENLQNRMEDVETLDEFPYTGGMFAPLWSSEHATVVGVGLYVEDSSGSYVMAGPDTQGYGSMPPTQMSIRYLTGADAMNAASGMESADELDEIFDVDQHDVNQIAEDLEAAGIDTGDIDFESPTDDSSNTDEDEVEVSEAEEKAESDGLLPFASPISVLAVIAIAGFIIANRKDES